MPSKRGTLPGSEYPPEHWWSELGLGNQDKQDDEKLLHIHAKRCLQHTFRNITLEQFDLHSNHESFLEEMAMMLYANYAPELWPESQQSEDIEDENKVIHQLRCWLINWAVSEFRPKPDSSESIRTSHQVIIGSLKSTAVERMKRLRLPNDNPGKGAPKFPKGHPAEGLYKKTVDIVKSYSGRKAEISTNPHIFAEDAKSLFSEYAGVLWKEEEHDAQLRSRVILDLRCWLAIRVARRSGTSSESVDRCDNGFHASGNDAGERDDIARDVYHESEEDTESLYQTRPQQSIKKRIHAETLSEAEESFDHISDSTRPTPSRRGNRSALDSSWSVRSSLAPRTSAGFTRKLSDWLQTGEGRVKDLGVSLISDAELERTSDRLGHRWHRVFDAWHVWVELNTQLDDFRGDTGYEGLESTWGAFKVSLIPLHAFSAVKKLKSLEMVSDSMRRKIRLHVSEMDVWNKELVSFIHALDPSCDNEGLLEAFTRYNKELLAWFE